jgi:putative flippase GtrA
MIWEFAQRLGRYLSVGVICALAFNVVMIGGAILTMGYVTSFLVCFFLVTALAYVLHARLTFRVRRSWRAFARFGATQIVGAVISFVLLTIFCSGFGMPMTIAAPLCTICLFIWNFILSHWAVGRRLPRAVWPAGR